MLIAKISFVYKGVMGTKGTEVSCSEKRKVELLEKGFVTEEPVVENPADKEPPAVENPMDQEPPAEEPVVENPEDQEPPVEEPAAKAPKEAKGNGKKNKS